MKNDREPTMQEAWSDFKYELLQLGIAQKLMDACAWVLDKLTALLRMIEEVVNGRR